jgi:hypothetical protein
MSNPLAIAAVTATLRNLLARVSTPLPSDKDTALSDTQVTTLPPDKAGQTDDHNQVNLFLYHVMPNAAGRNLDGHGTPGNKPGLALDLLYMVTVYGRNSDDVLSHRLLGRAMSLLHSYPVLVPADIAAALPGTDLDQQVDRIRLGPFNISNEEMVRLWGTFQVKYRLSVVYRAGVILIDHEQPLPTASAVQKVGINIGASVPANPEPST